MPVMAMILMDQEQRDDATALDNDNAMLGARQIDNPLSNNLGLGVLVGKWISPARLLNDPDYEPWYELMSGWPIHIFDSETLFAPYVEEDEAA